MRAHYFVRGYSTSSSFVDGRLLRDFLCMATAEHYFVDGRHYFVHGYSRTLFCGWATFGRQGRKENLSWFPRGGKVQNVSSVGNTQTQQPDPSGEREAAHPLVVVRIFAPLRAHVRGKTPRPAHSAGLRTAFRRTRFLRCRMLP